MLPREHKNQSERPTIRIFRGDGGTPSPPGLSPAMTWPQFYEVFFLPVCLIARQAARKNIKQYDETLDYWERFTCNPSLEATNDIHTADFLMELEKLPGRKKGTKISPNTIIKHCVHLQAVMDRAGPRSREMRNGQGLLDEVPYLARPKARKKDADDNFTLDEQTAILRSCWAARAPREFLPQREVYWQSLYLATYNLGLRIGSMMSLEWSMQYGGYLFVPVKGGDTRKIFINPWARVAIEAMRPITGRCERIWPWRRWPTSERWLHTNHRFILEAAGIPKQRQFGFHGFRKAMVTEASEFDPLAASLQAGHRNFQVTQQSYVNPKRVESGMSKLPQPKLPGRDQQARLFE